MGQIVQALISSIISSSMMHSQLSFYFYFIFSIACKQCEGTGPYLAKSTSFVKS